MLAVVGFVVTTYHLIPPRVLEKRAQSVGTATAAVLVDSSTSQAVDLGSATIGVLAYRAELLSALLMEQTTKIAIARELGVAPGLLVLEPPLPSTVTVGASVDPSGSRAYVLRALVPKLDGGANPIIQISSRAPTPAAATRLAEAAISALRGRLASVTRAQLTPPGRRLVLTQLAPAQGDWVQRGTGPFVNAATALGAFALACWLIIAISRIASAWQSRTIPLQMGREPT
jgi:hypothetical protein